MKTKCSMSNAQIIKTEQILNIQIYAAMYDEQQIVELRFLVLQAITPFIVKENYKNVQYDVQIDIISAPNIKLALMHLVKEMWNLLNQNGILLYDSVEITDNCNLVTVKMTKQNVVTLITTI
ncbi:Hypothetical_protein [Hexamita inflata]|uniref:Hypothetical_protein n=1 Tax=Hexamita inflata TaxID=28002 RepID=A0AA86QFL1_9EUKA|nr:Hypothetical protein HINF_LOCUS46011 [Hexamita inflata]